MTEFLGLDIRWVLLSAILLETLVILAFCAPRRKGLEVLLGEALPLTFLAEFFVWFSAERGFVFESAFSGSGSNGILQLYMITLFYRGPSVWALALAVPRWFGVLRHERGSWLSITFFSILIAAQAFIVLIVG